MAAGTKGAAISSAAWLELLAAGAEIGVFEDARSGLLADATHHHGVPKGRAGAATALGGPALALEPTLPPAVSVVTPAATEPLIARPAKAGRFIEVGDQYPEVWLLPVALVVLVPFTVRALTKDLTRNRS